MSDLIRSHHQQFRRYVATGDPRLREYIALVREIDDGGNLAATLERVIAGTATPSDRARLTTTLDRVAARLDERPN